MIDNSFRCTTFNPSLVQDVCSHFTATSFPWKSNNRLKREKANIRFTDPAFHSVPDSTAFRHNDRKDERFNAGAWS
jgi:hypothetical protein